MSEGGRHLAIGQSGDAWITGRKTGYPSATQIVGEDKEDWIVHRTEQHVVDFAIAPKEEVWAAEMAVCTEEENGSGFGITERYADVEWNRFRKGLAYAPEALATGPDGVP